MTTIASTTLVEPNDVAVRELNAADRCDHSSLGEKRQLISCGAQAFYLLFDAVTGEEKLQFCKHHYIEKEPGLAATGWGVKDFTYMLNEKPTTPEDFEV